MTPRGQAPPGGEVAPGVTLGTKAEAITSPANRVEGWTHYYEYFHQLDAAMQRREAILELHQLSACDVYARARPEIAKVRQAGRHD